MQDTTSKRQEPMTGAQLGTAILRALGIETHGVLSMGIKLDAEAAASVSVERFIGVDDAGKIVTELKRYGLQELPEPAAVQPPTPGA